MEMERELAKQIIRARGILWEQYSKEFPTDGEVVQFLIDRLAKVEQSITDAITKVDELRDVIAKVS